MDAHDSGVAAATSRTESPLVNTPRRKVIMVEEFPTAFGSKSLALASFQSILLRYLASTIHTENNMIRTQTEPSGSYPIVIILSETSASTSRGFADSFTAHKVLGPDIIHHPGVTTIEFNPIAPTFLSKALELVIRKEAFHSGRRRTPGRDLLTKLGEVGDIRSAIGSLEFICLRGDNDSDWSGAVVRKGKKKEQIPPSPLTKTEYESMEAITHREASLDIFHSVGRVVYNKRVEFGDSYRHIGHVIQPPEHLTHHARPGESEVSVDSLMDDTGTDIQTFIAALHENFVLSCNGDRAVESLNGCIDFLSDCDILSHRKNSGVTGWQDREAYSGNNTVDVSMQHEICFHISALGLLFALPYPVKRRSNLSRGSNIGRDSYKMFYPTSMRIRKAMEEIEGLVERYLGGMSLHKGQHRTDLKKHSSDSVETWAVQSPSSSTLESQTLKPERSSILSNSGDRSARLELILERLPYIWKIRHGHAAQEPDLNGIDRIVQFKGLELPKDEELDTVDDLGGGPITGSLLVLVKPDYQQNATASLRRNLEGRNHSQAEIMEKLVLSDDDIEDD